MAVLGIDPKNDFAFKSIFGVEAHTRVLIHMLNAVLKPPPGRRVESQRLRAEYSVRYDEQDRGRSFRS